MTIPLPQKRPINLNIAQKSYYLLQGRPQVIVGENQATLALGESVLIPRNVPHKIWNESEEGVVFLAICPPAWDKECYIYLE